MHIHGLSHHGNPWGGSMGAHSHYARATGTEVIWWSDHHHLFHPSNYDFQIAFAGARTDEKSLDVLLAPELEIPGGPAQTILPAAPSSLPVNRFLTRLMAQSSGGMPVVSLKNESLDMRLQASHGAQWQSFSLTPRGPVYPHVGFWPNKRYERMVRSYFFARPLTSRLHFRVAIEPGPLSSDLKQQIIFDLTWHHIGRDFKQRLIYNLVPDGQERRHSINNPESVALDVPVRQGVNKLDFDLLADAGLLEEGADNTILEMFFRLQARNGKTASWMIREFGLVSQEADPIRNFDALARIAEGYQSKYGVRQMVGVEWTEKPHLNGFFPKAAAPRFSRLLTRYASPNFDSAERPSSREFVDAIHGMGGLVSLNHVFGGSHAGLSPVSERFRRGTELARQVLDTQAHGADFLEAGYTHRGGADLNDHLRLWDLLTANGLLLTGTGVSDTHQVPWGEFTKPETFVTWVWSPDNSDISLLESLKHRRAFFGSPFRFQGRFDMRLLAGDKEARMGDVIHVKAMKGRLYLEMEPMREDDHVFLVQAVLKKGLDDPDYLVYHRRIDPNQPVSIDLSQPSFVRVEVYSGKRLPVVFSNPIVIRRN